MATIVESLPNPVRLAEGGVLKVADTRVSLDSLVYAYNDGMDAAEIQSQFDTLSLGQVHAGIAYYLHNKAKIDEYLRQNEIDYEKRRAQNKIDIPNGLTREMLLARKNGTDPDWNK